MLISLSFMWHMFAIIAFLFIQMKSMKIVYFILKKTSPQLDELLLADLSPLENKTYAFHELVNEEEDIFIENNGAHDSLRLNVKKESSSSGNSSLHSYENKSSV